MPKGSFYNYFASKEHFAAEILDTYAAQLMKQFDAYIEKSLDTPLELIESVYDLMLQTFEFEGVVKGCLLGNMAAEIGGQSELCSQSMLETVKQWKLRVVRLMEQAQQAGQIRQDVPASDLADVLWCTWEGGLLRMKIEGNTDTVRQTLRVLLRKLIAA